jgi:hypothetical protein
LASGLYSTQFAKLAGPGTSLAYVVPAGYRAVVRSIIASTNATGASNAWVYLGATVIAAFSIPAPNVHQTLDLRQVAYAGEQLGFVTGGASVFLAVSGYLLRDPTGAQAPPLEAMDTPLPLPAAA